MKLASKYGWYVIEDTAEAFGTTLIGSGDEKNHYAGTIGDFGIFSFYISHNLQGGELGAVVTRNKEAARIMRSMKNHGRVGNKLEFNHSFVGSNYKTTEFSAALLLDNLDSADEILTKRLDNARYLHDNIKNKKLEPFPITDGFSPLGYPIKAVNKYYRDIIVKKLNDSGVETRNMFPCLASQQAYDQFFNEGDYKNATELAEKSFYVGIHQYLDREDLDKMIEVLNE